MFKNPVDFINSLLDLQYNLHEGYKLNVEPNFNPYKKNAQYGYGILDLEDKWYYRKHGCGVFFKNIEDGTVVDIEERFDNIYLFTSLRLSCYFDSVYKTDIDTFFMDELLHSLCFKGVIKKEESFFFLANT